MLRSILIQAVVFLLIFNGVAMLREMSMLSTSDHVTPKPQQLKTIFYKQTVSKLLFIFLRPGAKYVTLVLRTYRMFIRKRRI